MSAPDYVIEWGKKFVKASEELAERMKNAEPRERRKRREISKVSQKAKTKSAAGYIYIMKSGGWYKIGMTSRKSGRLGEIRVLFPIVKLITQIACEDAGKVETYLHKKYKKQRITHEWYKLTKQDIQWFKSLKDHDLDEVADAPLRRQE